MKDYIADGMEGLYIHESSLSPWRTVSLPKIVELFWIQRLKVTLRS